jgi:hypothetical protein
MRRLHEVFMTISETILENSPLVGVDMHVPKIYKVCDEHYLLRIFEQFHTALLVHVYCTLICMPAY